MSRKSIGAIVALLVGSSVFVSACSSASSSTPPVQEVVVQAGDLTFEPSEIRVKVGQPVRVILRNGGTLLHDFSSDDAKVAAMKSAGAEHAAHDANSSKPNLHVAAEAGKSATLEFTPTQAGTYAFYCSVEGHSEAGMKGTLIVSP